MIVTRTIRAFVATAAISVAVTLTGCSGGIVDRGVADDAVILDLASYMSESHPYSKWYQEWAAEVTERTDGRVTFKNYWSDSLLDSSELAPGASEGQVDLAHTSTSYNPAMFPLSELLSVPFATEEIGAAVEATTTLYGEGGPYFEEFEDDDLIPLQFQPAGTNVLGTSRPVESMDDLAGLKVRSGSYFTDAMLTAGANPISMPLGDVYQSMQTGLADAWMTPMENAVQFKLAEVSKHLQDPGMGGFGLVVLAINKESFESLSEADQQVLLETSADYNKRFIEEMLVPMDADACQSVRELGAEPSRWSDEAIEQTRAKLAEPMLQAYLDDMAAAEVPGEEFADRWAEFQESYNGGFGEYPGSVQPCVKA